MKMMILWHFNFKATKKHNQNEQFSSQIEKPSFQKLADNSYIKKDVIFCVYLIDAITVINNDVFLRSSIGRTKSFDTFHRGLTSFALNFAKNDMYAI